MVDEANRLKTDGPVIGGIICVPGIHVSTFCGWLVNPKKTGCRASWEGRKNSSLFLAGSR